MKSIRSKGRLRSKALAASVVGAVVLGVLSFSTGTAVAHDGEDHEADAGAAAALDWKNYEKVLLTKNVGEPIDMAVLPDKRILHTARNGDVRLTDPATGVTSVVNTIPAYTNSEDGLQSVGIDPNFAENNWVYIVYAPLSGTPTGSAPTVLPAGADPSYWDQWMGVNRLSRFKWDGDSLDLATEQKIIDVPVQRGQCCHVGADFDWDDAGNLYLSTGDNTPASAPGANGFAPNNDAPNMNPGLDSRRGAGNTNDLRGKILRITVQADGSYTIPAGNLFPVGTEKTKPEIFVMGVRNPFRIDVDSATNSLSWGDYGPDATAATAAAAGRGPMGLVEWNTTPLNKPINSGWPYMTGNNFVYNEWNYATSSPGPFFDPAALKNNSRWNTGLVDLPVPIPATIWYGDNPGDQPFDELVNFGTSNGQGPMGGPVYHYDADNPAPSKFPEYWDNKEFLGEFSQDYIAALTVDWATSTVTHLEDFLPNSALTAAAQPIHDNPMDLEFGPDGSLYVLEYGDGFFRANPDAGLYRIDYILGNKTPQARFAAVPTSSSSAPLTIAFDAAASTDPEAEALTYEWDFDGNGSFDATGVQASHTYTTLGQFTARLRVTDPGGKFGLTSKTISVGNQAPVVTVDYPGDGAFFKWGQAIPYKVTTTDAEDGTATVCTRVSWTYGLGHDEHAHPEVQGSGCTGAFTTSVDSPQHGAGANLYGAVVVTYTDNGNNGLPAAPGEAALRLNPFEQQGEHALVRQGVIVYDDESASGGRAIRGLGNGDHLRYGPVNFTGIDGVVVRANGGGEVQLRWGAADAAPFATATIPGGGGWKDVTVPLTAAPTGSGQLYVTSASELAVDALTFTGIGVGDITAPTISHVVTPAAPTGVGGVYNRAVSVQLLPVDNGVIRSVQRSMDNGATWTTVNAAAGAYRVAFNTNGTYSMQYRTTDTSGLLSPVGTVSFVVNLAAPNEPTVASATAISVPAAGVIYGAPGSLTVTVSGAGGVPTGDVVLSANGAEIGRATLAGGSAAVPLTSTLPVGTHVITGKYLADQVFKTSTGTARLTVTKAGSVVTASVSPNPVKPAIAAKVTINAETSTGLPGSGAVTVHVQRNLSTVASLTGTLDASGNLVVTLPKLSVGSYKITVTNLATASTTAGSTRIALSVQQ